MVWHPARLYALSGGVPVPVAAVYDSDCTRDGSSFVAFVYWTDECGVACYQSVTEAECVSLQVLLSVLRSRGLSPRVRALPYERPSP